MSWSNKNVLITGISGFVGSYLSDKLLEEGANVFGLVRNRADGSIYKNLFDKKIVDDVTLTKGDLLDITSIANALDESSPDYIFHLGAQSFVPRSFENSAETQQINGIGTSNLLEAVISKEVNPKVIFAGSSEEYGLIISSKRQYENAKKEYGTIFPEPERIPEVPTTETDYLRPMSPYAVSKVYGDYLMRNYYHSYGLDTVVSRAFNHEGAGRGLNFVTSVITNQAMKYKLGEIDKIKIGNINAFRDWTHVKDIINGYLTLAEKGRSGDVYNQGSMRTNSVLTYILLSLEESGFPIDKIETFKNDKIIKDPTETDKSEIFGINFEKTKVDQLILEDNLNFTLKDEGINVYSGDKKIKIEFDENRFRPAEVPILLSNTDKIQKLGLKTQYTVNNIIKDQLNYFLKKENRE
ncbi:GDP-mannose 4,6-dehydratase [Methanobrevibacter filiformis]|uniref:GDP-6-deoxy-D-mannose reductase n=1 Tax=Methanobrevibacter filiformis TaxID=55758 RepID=A0A165ZTR1_9EURY|nr:GDP-mannose 4,6-dehydratase [Methanobrevibacter filiformis]KZX11149.1 GDP-6-deoxy-D-mannose reductase [Methanobrevibacter filiformis]